MMSILVIDRGYFFVARDLLIDVETLERIGALFQKLFSRF